MKKKINYFPAILLSLFASIFFLLGGYTIQAVIQKNKLESARAEVYAFSSMAQRTSRLVLSGDYVEKDIFLLYEALWKTMTSVNDIMGENEEIVSRTATVRERWVKVLEIMEILENNGDKEQVLIDLQLIWDHYYIINFELGDLLQVEIEEVQKNIIEMIYAMLFLVVLILFVGMYGIYQNNRRQLRSLLIEKYKKTTS